MDFLDMNNLRFWPDYDKRIITFYFSRPLSLSMKLALDACLGFRGYWYWL